MLSFEEFDRVISAIKKKEDALGAIWDALGGGDKLLETSSVEDTISLLEHIFNDDSEWISYWFWELDCGAKWEPGTVTGPDGEDIKFQTTRDLYDYLTGRNASMPLTVLRIPFGYDMEDFEITYNPVAKTYNMSLETIYAFEDKDAAKEYLRNTLDAFTCWMKRCHYDTNHEVTLWQIFEHGDGMKSSYNSIEEAYAVFKLLVNGALTVNIVGEEYGGAFR